MNDTIHAMMTRRSIRSYRADPVPKELLEQILQAGTYAANGRGKQSPVILAVTNREKRDQLSRMNAQIMGREETFDPFYGAPVVLVVLADRSVPTYVYDGSLVMGNLMLAANALGLGSCWVHRAKEEFDSPEGREFLNSLGIQGDYEGIGHCILGYPAGPVPEVAHRKPSYIYSVD